MTLDQRKMSEQPAKKPKLTGEDYLKLRSELRERKKLLKRSPRFTLNDVGKQAQLSFTTNEKCVPIFINDIQHLIMNSHIGSPNLRWGKLEKIDKIPQVTILIIEGLSVQHYINNTPILQNLHSHFDKKIEFLSPLSYGGSIVEELLTIPLNREEKYEISKKFGSLATAAEKKEDMIKVFRHIFPINNGDKSLTIVSNLPRIDQFDRTQLLLSPQQMIEENYPLPLSTSSEDIIINEEYVPTKDKYIQVTPASPMFGLDCEMCLTLPNLSELTRISVVDEDLNVIYDSLVKPDNKITNYLTRYSGITEKMMRDVNVKLQDVQNTLRDILPADAILVGQSLNFDLHALKMMHPYVIDTSVIFNLSGIRSKKSKLKVLMKEFLGETIQENGIGHCSTEDSSASMKLVQLKLANSVDFGDAVFSNNKTTTYSIIPSNVRNSLAESSIFCTSTIFNRLQTSKKSAVVGCLDIIKDYVKYLKLFSVNITESIDKLNEKETCILTVAKHKEAIHQMIQLTQENISTFCHLKFNSNKIQGENIKKTLERVDKWANMIWHNMPKNGLLCILFAGEESNRNNGAAFINLK